MSRIGDNLPRPLRSAEEAPQKTASTGELATTEVLHGETSLAQVAERLQVLLELLTQLNPQLVKQRRLETGQDISYPQAPAHPFAVGTPPEPEASSAASRRTEAMFDGMQNRQLASQSPAGGSGGLRTIPPFDPTRGPQVTNDMWTDEMLSGEVTADQLRNIVDPAAFLNARLERRQRPTEACWVSTISGARQSVNPSQMSTADDAAAMLQRLRALGYTGAGVNEQRPENPFSRIEYGSDPRRHFHVGDFNVGLLLERYAKYPKEEADRMTMAEMHQGGLHS